jgi:hypothetical protein
VAGYFCAIRRFFAAGANPLPLPRAADTTITTWQRALSRVRPPVWPKYPIGDHQWDESALCWIGRRARPRARLPAMCTRPRLAAPRGEGFCDCGGCGRSHERSPSSSVGSAVPRAVTYALLGCPANDAPASYSAPWTSWRAGHRAAAGRSPLPPMITAVNIDGGKHGQVWPFCGTLTQVLVPYSERPPVLCSPCQALGA